MRSGYTAFNQKNQLVGCSVRLQVYADNADPLFALVITAGFCRHHVEVVDQDPASGTVTLLLLLLPIMSWQLYTINRPI